MKLLKSSRLLAVGLLFFTPAALNAKTADSVGIVNSGQFAIPVSEPGAGAYIELNHQKQETNLCVPSTASMVLGRSGRVISPREIKLLASNKRQRRNQEFDDFTATMFVDLIAGLSKIGIRWEQRTYRDNKHGFRDGLKEMKAALDKGLPVLTDTSLYGGHTFAVVGYDEAKQQIIAIDPAIDGPGLRVLAYDEFEDIWNSRGVGFNGRGAVFTTGAGKR